MGQLLGTCGKPFDGGVVGEGETDDVEADRCQEPQAGCALDGVTQGACATDAPFGDLTVAVLPVRPQGEPGGESAQATGVLRREVGHVGGVSEGAEVRRRVPEDVCLQVGAAGELHGAVVGDVQPLVQVDADRVGQVQAVDQVREDAFTAARGSLAYLVPDFHNPTGALMPPHTRRTVSRLVAEHQVTLVVDETMRDLDLRDRPDPVPRVRGALLIGSTSKSIWGGLRIGWIRASASLIRELQDHPLAGPLSASPMQQLVAAELLGDLEPVLGRRRQELRQQRDHLSNLIADDGRWHFALPSGGLALWLRLTTALADTVVERARRNGVALASGPQFAADATLVHHLRVPYTPPLHVLDEIAAVLDDACRDGAR